MFNRVFIVGNLGKDAEVRATGGSTVANFSVATTETWRDKQSGEKKEQTEWHRVVLWGKSAEAVGQYLLKGKQVLVEGRLQTRKWQDKSGADRWSTEIRADRVVLLGGPREGDGSGRRQSSRSRGGDFDDDQRRPDSEAEAPDVGADDIPF